MFFSLKSVRSDDVPRNSGSAFAYGGGDKNSLVSFSVSPGTANPVTGTKFNSSNHFAGAPSQQEIRINIENDIQRPYKEPEYNNSANSTFTSFRYTTDNSPVINSVQGSYSSSGGSGLLTGSSQGGSVSGGCKPGKSLSGCPGF